MKSLDDANGGLDAAMLYARCDPDRFDFETTAELEDFGDAIGQARAVDAVRFGVEVRREGYNVFVLGPPGTGKRTLVRRFVEERAAGEPSPPEWAYVNNFERPNKPCLLRLPRKPAQLCDGTWSVWPRSCGLLSRGHSRAKSTRAVANP